MLSFLLRFSPVVTCGGSSCWWNSCWITLISYFSFSWRFSRSYLNWRVFRWSISIFLMKFSISSYSCWMFTLNAFSICLMLDSRWLAYFFIVFVNFFRSFLNKSCTFTKSVCSPLHFYSLTKESLSFIFTGLNVWLCLIITSALIRSYSWM